MAQTPQIELLALLAATAVTRTALPRQSPAQVGLILSVITANGASTPSFLPSLEMKVGTVWETFWTAAAPITADVITRYVFYPGLAGTDGTFLERLNLPLPNLWRMVLTRTTGNADTTVHAQVLG